MASSSLSCTLLATTQTGASRTTGGPMNDFLLARGLVTNPGDRTNQLYPRFVQTPP
jgi:hypothetical protein